MKNADKWTPSKYVLRGGLLRASKNPMHLGVASRLIADIVAAYYGTFIPQHVTGRLIDLGCGNAPLYQAYQDHISSNICVDWANTLHKNQFLDLECDLTKKLPFDDEEFDTIILSDVLEHVPDPQFLVAEMHRILKVGGKVLLNVPFYYMLHETPRDFYRYTEYALRNFATAQGFQIVVLNSIGGVPEIVADILAKNCQLHIPKVGVYLAIGIQGLTYSLLKTNLGKAISKATSGTFPFGYFMVVEK